MTTLVTGAGLLGTSFAAHARSRGEAVVFFDPEPRKDFIEMKLGGEGWQLVRGDVRNLAELTAAIQTHRATTVVHTASLIAGRVQREVSSAFDINIIGTRNVAEAVRLAGVRRLVHLSTYGTYDLRRPLDEWITEAFPLGPGGGAYGNFKVAKEMILETYALEFKFELVMLRPAHVFGLGHFWGGSTGGAKMQELMEAGISGRKARIAARDAQEMEYVYAKDVGAALDLAATVPAPKELAFNIGNGRVSTFDELIAAVREVYPRLEVEIEPGETPPRRVKPLDITRAERQLGWKPRYTLVEALRDYHADLAASRQRA